MNQRQCGFALGEVVADVLAQRIGAGAVIEHIVNQLESDAQMPAVFRHRQPLFFVATGEYRRDPRAGFEQFRRLAKNHIEVLLLGGLRVAAVDQLQDLAFGNGVGRIGQDPHDLGFADFDHHLERPRVEEIPDQHAGLVAPDLVGGVVAAAFRGFIDDIVVQQRGRVDKLDDRRRRDPSLRRAAAGTPGSDHDQRPQALATAVDDVIGDLVDQDDIGTEFFPYQAVCRRHIVRQEFADCVKLHWEPLFSAWRAC